MVMAMVECPRRSDTTLGWTPAASASDAHVWRRLWTPRKAADRIDASGP